MIEKRFEQIKTVHEIAPVFLKNEGRIEALFTPYFLALLVQALIERELRLAMKRENIADLPLYPEQRLCAHPTTEQILGPVQPRRATQTDPRWQHHASLRRPVHGPAASAAHITRRPRTGISAARIARKIHAKFHLRHAECKDRRSRARL